MYKLVALNQLLVSDVDAELTELVARNRERLALDFPAVPQNYVNVTQAARRLDHLQFEMAISLGEYGVFVVYFDGEVAGMVTYSMEAKWFLVPGKGLVVLRGPLVAGWLDRARPNRAKRKGAEVLRLLASEVVSQDEVTGRAWSVARPDNKGAIRALEAADNGFGGFAAVGRPRRYRAVDGVVPPRQLYMCTQPMKALAEHALAQK